MNLRSVEQVVTAHRQLEGGGFVVRRPFPSSSLEQLDPLLLLDEMGPVNYRPGEAIGAPDHPHRGFETVTYLLEGEGAHADSAGHAGTLTPGDVQWMTAGAGVVHREMPSERIKVSGGRVHGFQLWVNLPRGKKMIPPRYQELPKVSIPEATSSDGLATVRVISGEALGVRAVVQTHTPIIYQHWRLSPGAAIELPLPADHRVGVYVFKGAMAVCAEPVNEGQLAVLGDDEALSLATTEDSEALVLGGKPLNEPIAWNGPFVMNTPAELRQAFEDYRTGKMGKIPPEIVRA